MTDTDVQQASLAEHLASLGATPQEIERTFQDQLTRPDAGLGRGVRLIWIGKQANTALGLGDWYDAEAKRITTCGGTEEEWVIKVKYLGGPPKMIFDFNFKLAEHGLNALAAWLEATTGDDLAEEDEADR